MKLTYRGTSYDYNPPTVEFSNSDTVGKYRGLDVRFRNPVKTPVLQPTLDLMYRGVAYTTKSQEEATPVISGSVDVAPVQAVALNLEDKARSLMMGHNRWIKRRQQAMMTRMGMEVGLATAESSTYWNRIQGKVHPTFRKSYDRSGAALS
jgi:hypothetical protein